MSNLSTEIVDLLRYLLPGFLTAWVFYGFTSYPKPSEFERVIQALIFNLFVQAMSYCSQGCCLLVGNFYSFGNWNVHSDLFNALICATILGFLFAYFCNTDKFHAAVRKLGVTKETAYPSEWFGVFCKNSTYVVLHLLDERRIYGWPTNWPSEPTKGHFSLEQASWLTDNGKEQPLSGVCTILIRAEDVRMVEFMKTSMEYQNGSKSTESAATASSASKSG